ncbi:MAG: glycoside hydrolase family 2 TIM barrel-domain containing protein [Lachnospiraceae bacterium]
MYIEKYYEDPQALHIGTEENRSYYLPYSTEKGDRTILLSSDDWKFMWYENVLDVPDSFITGKATDFDTIYVPSCIQMLGYDKHQYANVLMPIPFDPPYAPSDNPCGAYIKEFEVDEMDEEYYLNFEGVDSCFYVWINGAFVGYSQVSHSTSEFHVSQYIRPGKNTLAVLVLKWCDGTYFEDQDKLRMTGIFRDVYLLKRSKKHIVDYRMKPKFLYGGAYIVPHIEVNSADLDVQIELYDADGQKIMHTTYFEGLVLEVENPHLWNAEDPYLYKILLKTDEEVIEQKVGLRNVQIKDAILYLNGQKILFKGTNRHDSDAVTGYTISREQLIAELKMMKEHNMNAIRTSHYPNAPWAYELFSEYGFYIIDEADIETHNAERLYTGYVPYGNYKKELFEVNTFGRLCSDPTYEATILDRVQRCVSRDKNQACVVMWSLGNESAYGVNMEKAAAWIKDQDRDYLVHYESSIYEMVGHENDLSNIDVYSRMYMPSDDCDLYCSTNPKRPLVLCEYVACLGNGPGDIEDYFEIMYKHDTFCGGFVWEWTDHAVYDGETESGKPKYLYGGDFGEFPNEKNFCVDGMVTPEKTPHTGLIEYKNVARPIRALFEQNEVMLFNTMDFTNLKDRFIIDWAFINDGEKVESGTITDFDLLPHERKACDIPYDKSIKKVGLSYLMIQFVTKEEEPFVAKGTVLGFDQILFQKETVQIIPEHIGELFTEETDREYLVKGSKFTYVFGKYTGTIQEIIVNNYAVMSKPCEYNIWRPSLDNDRKINGEWLKAGYNRKTTRVYNSEAIQKDGSIEITYTLGIGAQYLQNSMVVDTKFVVHSDGTLEIKLDVKRDVKFPYLPRFGLRFYLPKEFESVCYSGYGPYESYADKHRASYFGNFTDTVTNMHVDYLVPQENGSHYACDFMEVSNQAHRLAVSGASYSFNISHYTQEQLEETKHNFELEESDYTVLCLDAAMSGVGSSCCGPHLIEQYRVDDERIVCDFVLKIR